MLAEPLNWEVGKAPDPIPGELSLLFVCHGGHRTGALIVTNDLYRPAAPCAIERAVRDTRASVAVLPAGFRFQDLGIHFEPAHGRGLDVRTVQARLQLASATTTLDAYGQMWSD